MTNRSFEPPSWRFHRWLWGIAIATVCIMTFAKTIKIEKSKISHFIKAKESRRGALRLAKERKQNVDFTQDRSGVSRHLWIQDPGLPRRQFFLEAVSATLTTSLTSKEISLIESFVKPKGWFQEELFWEISSTGERVIKKGDKWVHKTPPCRSIAEKFIQNIVPMQLVWFFEAATADWNQNTNKLVANTALFTLLKMPGHEAPINNHDGKIITQGTSRAMIFEIGKPGQQVRCQGTKLQINQETTNACKAP